MSTIRDVATPFGPISYRLERKQVKNLNLRITGAGEVVLSIPNRCTTAAADDMILGKAEWITQALEQRERLTVPMPPLPDRETCRILLTQAVEAVYGLVAPDGVEMPEIRLRTMKSQWGNCHWMQGYITLNTALARCPRHLREYVALHELVHFLHHDHSPRFHAAMDQRMPDWRERRKELRRYSQALSRD